MENGVLHSEEVASAIEVIFSRRAVRKYKDIPVQKELIEKIIDAGRMAPSAMNQQSWNFYVVADKALIESFSKAIQKVVMKKIVSQPKQLFKTLTNLLHFPEGTRFLKTTDHVFYGAPVVIFITGPKNNEWAALDTGMCVQNMMLAAKAMGLESCPIGFARYIEHTDEYTRLHIPLQEEILLAVIVGYGAEKPEAHPRKKHNVIYIE